MVTKGINNRFRNKAQTIVSKSKISNFKNVFERNVCKTWGIINTLVNHKRNNSNIMKIISFKREIFDYHEMSEIFNDYSSGIAEE